MDDQNKMNVTLTIISNYQVKAGFENDFIQMWTSFSRWSSENLDGSGIAYLFQDIAETGSFHSLWPWLNQESLSIGEANTEYKKQAEELKGFCKNTNSEACNIVSSSLG
jgi:heme-degrading monooxygenase HmoA